MKKLAIKSSIEERKQKKELMEKRLQDHNESYLGKWGRPKDRQYIKLNKEYENVVNEMHEQKLQQYKDKFHQAMIYKPSSVEFK